MKSETRSMDIGALEYTVGPAGASDAVATILYAVDHDRLPGRARAIPWTSARAMILVLEGSGADNRRMDPDLGAGIDAHD